MLNDLKYISELERYEDKDGTSWENEKDYLQISVLGFCGCGNQDDVMGYVYDMLKKVDNVHYEFEYSDIQSMFFLYWADKQNFIEHGTTIRCPWLTDLGKQLITDIESCMEY